MPLFGKKKADSDKAKDQKKANKKVQDRFMVHAMEAKFSDAKSNDLLEADFTGAFSEKNLAVTGRLTDRTLLGRGEFDRPYQKAKLITRSYARYLTGDDEPNDQQITEMIAAFKELETLAGDWLKSAEAKWSVKGSDKQDKTTQIKVVEANGMLKGARKAIFQLENRALLQDDKTKQLIDNLETAKESGDVEAYRSADTQLLAAVCGTLKPDNGTSDVLLIKDPSGEVAYAFKSVQGESDMMGTQKGFATAREVLMSKMCDGIKEKYGLDFPWPKATMAKVGGKTGALIDGVQGMKVPSDELQKQDVPAETLQKILLCNLAGGQFDIKWEDVRFVRNGDKLDATCMDGGAAMPDPDTATNFLAGLSDGKPGQQIIDNGDPQTGGFYPEALKPMSADLVAQFLSIKVKDLKADMDAQAKLLEKEHGLKVADLGLDSGIQSAMTSIEGIQKILNDAGGNITLAKFMEKFHADVVQKKFVEPKLAAWQQTQRAAYRQLLADHPGLFAPARDDEDVGELYRRALHPEVKARLRKLAALALPASIADMLRSYGVPVPINTAGDELEASVGKIQAAIANGLPAYDKERTKYPGLIVPKESFRTLAEAYIAVLHPSQSFALGQLKSLALKLSQDEGKTVTIAGLLQRYRFNVPTSDFKDKYNTIMADIKSKAKAT